MRLEMIPFTNEHLDEAAKLLAARHTANRAATPALPARFQDPTVARTALEMAWQQPGASGVVALHAENLIGYMIGEPQVTHYRGRTIWIKQPNHAVDAEYSPELYRDLYAALSPHWIEQGYFDHCALILATDRPTLDAWFALSFGQEQAYGIREVAQPPELPAPDPSLRIRRASIDDLDALLKVGDVVMRHQSRSPVYSPLLPEDPVRLREGYQEVLNDPKSMVWLALRDDRVIAFQLLSPGESSPNDMLTPENCIHLELAATHADEQGRGIGRALQAHTMHWAHEEGYQYCLADWRVTNLLSSRFWPRQGFRPTLYRLSRRLDERIAWAKG
ncbi:MAG: GNAT family N-acetyltransferase [Ktedonobacteraceae bacterium]|nr:GNAT family N-acetyltransferase [Ktedonobacteraceae bacterium]